MSKSKNSMTKSALLRRGWTNELIETLLPKPTYIHVGDGHKVLRTWRKSVVAEAELTPEFIDKHRVIVPEAPAARPAPEEASRRRRKRWTPPASGRFLNRPFPNTPGTSPPPACWPATITGPFW